MLSNKMTFQSQSFAAGTNNSNTVLFDVGGMHYRVSRSLLDQHPQSVLARMISDTWSCSFRVGESNINGEDDKERSSGSVTSRSPRENSDSSDDDVTKNQSTQTSNAESPFFIERDGERFTYVLDFMRHGTVTLPYNIPMEQFLFDLDYYGIEGGCEGTTVRYGHCVNGAGHVGGVDQLMQQRQRLLNDVKRIDRKLAAMSIASHCFGQYIVRTNPSSKSVRLTHLGDEDDSQSVMYDLRLKLSGKNTDDVALLNECLSEYGLTLRTYAVNQGNVTTGIYDKVTFRVAGMSSSGCHAAQCSEEVE